MFKLYVAGKRPPYDDEFSGQLRLEQSFLIERIQAFFHHLANWPVKQVPMQLFVRGIAPSFTTREQLQRGDEMIPAPFSLPASAFSESNGPAL